MRTRQGRLANESLLHPAAADLDDLSDDSASENEDEELPVVILSNAAPAVEQLDSAVDGGKEHDGNSVDLPMMVPAASVRKNLKNLVIPSKKKTLATLSKKKMPVAPPKKLTTPPKKKKTLAAPLKGKLAVPPKKQPVPPPKKQVVSSSTLSTAKPSTSSAQFCSEGSSSKRKVN